MITQTYYISSGAKNAMYTLRLHRSNLSTPGCYVPDTDFYMGNLSTDPDVAERKALEFFDRMYGNSLENSEHKITFAGYADFPLNERISRLSVSDTQKIRMIEAGFFPFGKNIGKTFADVPESYVMYFADMIHKKPQELSEKPVLAALCAACQGYALEHEYIKKRDTKREIQREIDLQSEFVGEIGKRQDFEGVIFSVFGKNYPGTYEVEYHITKIRCGADIITYMGKVLGAVNETIKFRGTVKNHNTYQDIKTTVINRPAIIKE